MIRACFKNGRRAAVTAPQGLKPWVFLPLFGPTKAVPLLRSRAAHGFFRTCKIVPLLKDPNLQAFLTKLLSRAFITKLPGLSFSAACKARD